ncbi:MAG TPA: PBP1A family penicillin-binding protein [Terriglobales bacterium]|nr:PBP1A family penicillin-binding protein [Terriglobales bacterium]
MNLYSDLPPVQVAGKTFVGRFLLAILIVGAAVVGAVAGMFVVYSTDLPQTSELERYRPSAITEVYDDQGRVIGSFALQRRVIASFEDFPPVLKEAVLSIEDKDFDKHWGVDLQRVLGAAYRDIRTQSRAQGASTLTMQLSRNLFLSPERSFSRKIQEIILAIQIERRFTKPQIFTMYANQIYLGHGVYGFEAGSQYYFSKRARELTLEEAAVLASLPKSPTQYSPVNNLKNARRRRDLVLDAMLEDGKITAEVASRAKASPLALKIQPVINSVAPHFVEEIRRYLEKKYGSEDVHQNGLRVYTTLNLEWQKAANQATLDGLAAYEKRHGWKGKLENILATGATLERYHHADWTQPIVAGGYLYALVTAVDTSAATLRFGEYTAALAPADIKWTARKSPQELFRIGDLVYVKVISLPGSDGFAKVSLEQNSGSQASLLALDNSTGDIKAMVGGRSFNDSKFNRATQSLRQVGSAFKPFVYTAALDTETISIDDDIVDSPTTFMTASGPYTPSNYDGKFWGNIPLRRAVANSRNIPALKIAERVGIKTVIDYARKFGVTSPLPPYLPIALGAAEVTLMEETAAFTTFPNDGVRVMPRYIRKVTDYDGHVREENFPEVADVISPETARTMVSLLQGVVRQGTATAALKLKRDIAGKTGTTNDFTDAWFVGFSPSITCGVWIGYDEKKTLGPKETGGEAALPIWIDFMQVALQGREKEHFLTGKEVPADAPPIPVKSATAPVATPEVPRKGASNL